MIHKIYSLVLILVINFYFGDVFGNTILIGQEPAIHIINMKEKTIFNYDAKMITKSGCLKSSTVLQCGPLAIDFVNEKKIFAEFFLNYNERVVESPKIKINLIITFGEQNIILNHKKKQKYYAYDSTGINNLMVYILRIDRNIQFQVIKIYYKIFKLTNTESESNLTSNKTLAHSTVYMDNHVKKQLELLEKMSLWQYVKEEIVNVDISTQHNITLEDFINNSIKYKKNVVSTLEEALRIINDRTFKYSFLLVVYVYVTLKNDLEKAIKWESIIKVSEILSEAQIYPKISKGIRYDLRTAFLILQENIESSQRNDKIKEFIMKYSKLFLTTEEISKLELTKNFPQNVLNKVFQGFPRPHENDVISYNFETIPKNLYDIMQKFEIIFRLITTEYQNVFDIRYILKKNQRTG